VYCGEDAGRTVIVQIISTRLATFTFSRSSLCHKRN